MAEAQKAVSNLTQIGFDALDTDKNTKLSATELSITIDDGKASFQSSVKDENSFNLYDTDKNNVLSWAEAQAVAAKLTQAAFNSLDTDKNAHRSAT